MSYRALENCKVELVQQARCISGTADWADSVSVAAAADAVADGTMGSMVKLATSQQDSGVCNGYLLEQIVVSVAEADPVVESLDNIQTPELFSGPGSQKN